MKKPTPGEWFKVRWHKIGRRGAFMIVFGLMMFFAGSSLLVPPGIWNEIAHPERVIIFSLIPKLWWGIAFLFSSFLVFIEGWWKDKNDHVVSLTFMSIITAAWSMGNFAGGLLVDDATLEGVRSGFIWLFMTIIIHIVAGWPDYGRLHNPDIVNVINGVNNNKEGG